MGKTVQLHGGPWHGQQIEVPSDQDHFHIVGPATPPVEPAPDDPVVLKEGTYSQVAGPGNLHDFEWDGWVTHE